MPYRTGGSFNGTTSRIQLPIGASSGLDFGPSTVVLVAKVDTIADYFPLLSAATSGSIDRWALYNALGNLGWDDNTGATSQGSQTLPTTPWVCIAASKATGSAAPRFSLWDATGQTWVHANGSAMADSTTPGAGGFWWIGHDVQYALSFDGEIAGVAVFDKVLSDAERAGLTSGGDVLEAAISALAPVHYWTDLSSAVSGETSRTAITTGTTSPLLYTVAAKSLPPKRRPLALTYR